MFPESNVPRAVLVFVAIFVSVLLLYGAADSLRFQSSSSGYSFNIFPSLRNSNNSDSKLSVSFFPLEHFSTDHMIGGAL
jgi:hypothetical protein